ncbi:Mu homology domain-containing protein [Scheffersomyces xylosifermentans]|uniref:Mu homology domain-containing protein n=1 Tax=Scheffersomyces xylosifermentans TaxID=1304137 RepID=UPI00315DEB4B
MFEAVYIADRNNTLIYEYLINLTSPTFKSLTSIIRLNQNSSGKNHGGTSSHSHDSSNNGSDSEKSLIEINQDFFVVFEKTTNVIIYILCSTATTPNPIIPFTFIHRLIEVMSDYFGTPLALTKIDANNDTLTLLINEMIDNGMPNVTDFNKLRDLIPFKSFLSKILSTSSDITAATNKSLSSLTNPQRARVELASRDESLNSIPWRRSNVKYTNNEMYVDVVETINVILKPTSKAIGGKNSLLSSNAATHLDSAFYSTSSLKTSATQLVPIVGSIDGQVNFISHLTGIPLLQLILSVAGLNIQLPSFHQCINLEKYLENPGTLSFIPPDGKSTLMNYQIDLDSFETRRDQLSLLGLIDIDFQTGLGSNQNEFEIRLFIKNVKSVSKIENLTIEIFCEDVIEENSNDNDNNTSNSNNIEDDRITNIKSGRITHGDFNYKGHGRAEWNLRTISSTIQPMIHGSIITTALDDSSSNSEVFKESSEQPDLIEGVTGTGKNGEDTKSPRALSSVKPLFLKLSYSHKGAVPSGIKVDSLKIISAKGLGETVKPYKGVKYITKTGDFIVRS